jgi:hypothetical protein
MRVSHSAVMTVHDQQMALRFRGMHGSAELKRGINRSERIRRVLMPTWHLPHEPILVERLLLWTYTVLLFPDLTVLRTRTSNMSAQRSRVHPSLIAIPCPWPEGSRGIVKKRKLPNG